MKDVHVRARIGAYRRLLQTGKATFFDMICEERLLLALDQLHHYAHWITPVVLDVRFDTHFFIARHPIGQRAVADGTETTDGAWMTPQEALKENLKQRITLSPPALIILEELASCRESYDVFGSMKDKSPIVPIYVPLSEGYFVVFPWDPDYEDMEAGNMEYPLDHGQLSLPTDRTTRVVYRNGRAFPYRKLRIEGQ